MFLCKTCRYGDWPCDNEVSELPFFFINRKTFSFKSYFCSILSFRIDFDFYFAIKCIYFFISTKYSCVKIKWNRYIKIVAKALECCIFRDYKRNVKISGRTSIYAGATLSFEFDCLSICNTSRYCYSYFLPVYFNILRITKSLFK